MRTKKSESKENLISSNVTNKHFVSDATKEKKMLELFHTKESFGPISRKVQIAMTMD